MGIEPYQVFYFGIVMYCTIHAIGLYLSHKHDMKMLKEKWRNP